MDTTLLVIIASVAVLAVASAVAVDVVLSRRVSALSAAKDSLAKEKSELEGRANALESKLQAQEEAHRALDEQRERHQKELDAQRAEQQARLDAERAEQQAKLDAERAESLKALTEEREKAFESQRKQMEESFKALSEQNSAGLRRQNAESITELLKPIQEKFGTFEKSVQDSQEKSVAQDASMRELLSHVMDQSRTVGEEAKNLANALTGKAKVQGDFGEMLLVDLLKKSGLEEGVHFSQQGVLRDELGHEIKSETGKTMIPDVIVYYPDDTEVIVDSKVSLTAYVNWCNATTVEDKVRFAKDHVESVTRHIEELKGKDYASYVVEGKRKVDYNIMFIPMEGAFRLMLEESPTLWQMAKDAKVLIVSQMNLMVVLNMILMTWKQHDQEKNIAEVYKTASEMMGEIRDWLVELEKVGACLNDAKEAFDSSKKKLMDGRQSVVQKIGKLEKLGITQKRSAAKLKAGRMTGGYESVIPSSFAEGLENDEE